MIQANELRIGNWVDWVNRYSQIEELYKDTVWLTDGTGGTYSTMRPIPLTPEILQKAGFIEEVNGPYMKGTAYKWQDKHGTTKYLIANKWFLRTVGEKEAVIQNDNVGYLHTLMNLFFALEGTELEIKDL